MNDLGRRATSNQQKKVVFVCPHLLYEHKKTPSLKKVKAVHAFFIFKFGSGLAFGVGLVFFRFLAFGNRSGTVQEPFEKAADFGTVSERFRNFVGVKQQGTDPPSLSAVTAKSKGNSYYFLSFSV